ncbi:zinc knuckle CX2CX4HX4C [Artemisia annua]|uniref:Zinc knuckle CX2CX4HX4C n=1 Tax=Artemisia annua TaxID=35608 RepID=A0A2U1LA21_ARTAN|nr:zinc knuckle CX2CX4HX4C [Artemisia annua]
MNKGFLKSNSARKEANTGGRHKEDTTSLADQTRISDANTGSRASEKINVDVDARNLADQVGVDTQANDVQPNVEQLLANAHKNFEEAMDKIQSEIVANEVNATNTPPSSVPSAPKVDTASGTGVKSATYAGATSNEPQKNASNFRRLECSKKKDDVDLSVPMKVVEEVNTRFENTLYGYFLGQRLAFPVVDYYVRNAWAKFGVQKVMMNAKGFFFFKFTSKKGVDDVLENGPWLIRNVPIILKPWNLNTNLLKEDLTNIPVWVKFHDVPLAMFSDDGLSLLATLIGTPKRLDAFTSQMCKESWGRSSFARCMIEVKSDEVLRDSLTVEIPLLDGSGSTIEKIRVEYEWKPPRCDNCKIFGHTLSDCPKVVAPPVQSTKSVNDGFMTVNNRKKGKQGGSTTQGNRGFTKPVVGKQFQYQPKKTPTEPKKVDGTKKRTSDVPSTSGTKISTSNQFDALNIDDADAFGTPSNDNNKDVDAGSSMEVNADKSSKTASTIEVNKDESNKTGNTMEVNEEELSKGSTPIVEKIGKLEKLLIDGRATLVDDNGHPIPSTSATKRGNPFSKVGKIVVSDSEDEVANPFDESANLFGGGQEFEQEYDDYDDYANQVYDLPGNLDAFNAMYGTKLQGPRK